MTITETTIAEAGKPVREMAEEAERSAREAIEASIQEVTCAAEKAQAVSRLAIAQAEKVSRSVKEMAQELMKNAMEAAETAQAILQQAITRAEEFDKSAKENLEKAAGDAKQSADLAIREATEATETTKVVLRQAANRSEEIDNLARELADHARRSASEAVESAKKAFQESLSRSINRAEEARRLNDFEAKRGKEGNVAAETVKQEENLVEQNSREQGADRVEPARRSPWISAIGNSFKKPLRKNKEPGAFQIREEKPGESQAIRPIVIWHDETTENDDFATELYKGLVRIGVASGSEPEKVDDFEKQLGQLDNLKVLWTSGSEDEGTSIVVSLQKPTPLIGSLSALPAVKRTGKGGETVMVALKGELAA